jgi:hypothetical protein
VDVVSIIDADNSAKPVEIMGLKVKYNISGEQKGTLRLKKSSGIPESTVLTQKLEGNMEIEANDLVPQALKIPLTMEIKMTTEMKKL